MRSRSAGWSIGRTFRFALRFVYTAERVKTATRERQDSAKSNRPGREAVACARHARGVLTLSTC